MRAFFFSLDADAQLRQTDTEAFLSEIVEDVAYEELVDQVARGCLKLQLLFMKNDFRGQGSKAENPNKVPISRSGAGGGCRVSGGR